MPMAKGYMTRALKARDKRYATILGKLGKRQPQPIAEEDVAVVRAEYQERFGKKPFMGWDAPTIRAKMAEAGPVAALTTENTVKPDA